MIWRLFLRERLTAVALGTVLVVAWAVFAPATMWGPVAAGLMAILYGIAAPGRRSTVFEAALPIPARSLLIARLLFVMATVWFPLGAAALVLPGQGTGVWSAGMVLSAAGVFALTARIDQFGSHALWCAGFAGLVIVAQDRVGHDALIGVVCAAAAVGRLAYVWPRIPPTFQTAPIEAGEPRAARIASPPAFALLPVARSVLPPVSLAFLVVTVCQTLLGIWGFAFILGPSTVATARRSMRWLWALPFSRRRLLALAAGPYLACVVGGFAVGAWLRPFRTQPQTLLLNPTVDAWRIGRGSPIVAPWGETAVPMEKRFAGLIVYNPFTVGNDNSRRFHDWQFARATEAIYGEAMSPDEYRERREELRLMSQRPRGVGSVAGVVAAVAMLALFCFLSTEWRRVTDLPKPARYAVQIVAVALAFLPALSDVSTAITILALRVPPALALLLAAAAWLVLEWQSRTMEQGRPIPLTC